MRLTRRGRLVRALFLLIGLLAVTYLSTLVWYTPAGYCFGSFLSCNA